MDVPLALALLIGFLCGVGCVYLYQWYLRRQQRRAWINRNPRAHALLVERLKKEEWLER